MNTCSVLHWWAGPLRVDLYEGQFASVVLWLLRNKNSVLQVHLRVHHGEENMVPRPDILVFSPIEVIASWKEEGCLGYRGSDFSPCTLSTAIGSQVTKHVTHWMSMSELEKAHFPYFLRPSMALVQQGLRETLIYFGTSRICYRSSTYFHWQSSMVTWQGTAEFSVSPHQPTCSQKTFTYHQRWFNNNL